MTTSEGARSTKWLEESYSSKLEVASLDLAILMMRKDVWDMV